MAPDEWVMITLRDMRPCVVELTELFVPTDYRGRGFGSKALRWVLALVDKHNYMVESYVLPFGTPGLSKRNLASWYRRHGFVVSRDYTMKYLPKVEHGGCWRCGRASHSARHHKILRLTT